MFLYSFVLTQTQQFQQYLLRDPRPDILTHVATINKRSDCGLYRDDGQKIDRTCKDIIKIFKDVRFSIDIETNSKVVDFLGITKSKYNIIQIMAHINLINAQTIHC